MRERQIGLLLSLTAGLVDAFGYLLLGVFAANMTGNTVLVGIAVAAGHWSMALERSAALVAFFVGAMLGRLARGSLGRNSRVIALFLEALLIAVSAVLVDAHPWLVCTLALAMGVQATAMTAFEGAAVSTVVLTSTLARLAERPADLLQMKWLGVADPAPAGARVPEAFLAGIWVAYFLGAGLAVPLTRTPINPLAVAFALILVCALGTRVRQSKSAR